MRSPEFISHGTASEEDAEKIKEGFEVEEGRATVSGDLIYSFEWATQHERRRGSKSESKIDEDETGRIIIMKVPEDMGVNYATHTNVAINEEEKQLEGFPSKYVSGRKQLGIYTGNNSNERKEQLEEDKAEKKEVPKVVVHKEYILMSIVPTKELGNKLEEMRTQIRNLEKIDIEKLTKEITALIEAGQENFTAPDTDIEKVVHELLETTQETEVVNMVRAFSGEVKRAQGFTVYNRGKIIDKPVDIEKLKSKLNDIQNKITDANFDTGKESLNRYIKQNISMLLKQFESIS